MNWLKVFRIVLITDSVVAVLKLAIIITLFVDAIQWQQRFDKTEKYDNSYVEQFLIVADFLGTIAFLTLILLRLVTNYYQYRNEQGYNKMNWCSKVCCCGFCWFTVYILGIVTVMVSIRIHTSTSVAWINGTVSICVLCWDIPILCIMVIFKLLMRKITYPHVVQYDKHNSKEEVSA